MPLQSVSQGFKDISMTFQRNPLTGDLIALKNTNAITRSIRNIIFTYPGEKPFDPEFGSQLSRMLFENSDPINSNKEFFTVNKDDIELERVSQNIDLLMNLSSKSNGAYLDINNFNESFLDSLELRPIKKKFYNIYTPIDIFIKEYIFILVSILFCLEIFLRKKVGLL